MGEVEKSLSAMVYAAHLRPKDTAGWLRGASFALDAVDQNGDNNLHTARLCFSAAIRADPSNVEARLGKAVVCHRQGHFTSAINEYKTVLNRQPHDLETVRKLAEACIDSRQSGSAIKAAVTAYRRYFDFQMQQGWQERLHDLWHDIGIYVGLCGSDESNKLAIFELKSLARWVVGRGDELYWDDWQADDREWDRESIRRELVSDFCQRDTKERLYGISLPLELRCRLAIYRLRLNEEHEAFVSVVFRLTYSLLLSRAN